MSPALLINFLFRASTKTHRFESSSTVSSTSRRFPCPSLTARLTLPWSSRKKCPEYSQSRESSRRNKCAEIKVRPGLIGLGGLIIFMTLRHSCERDDRVVRKRWDCPPFSLSYNESSPPKKKSGFPILPMYNELSSRDRNTLRSSFIPRLPFLPYYLLRGDGRLGKLMDVDAASGGEYGRDGVDSEPWRSNDLRAILYTKKRDSSKNGFARPLSRMPVFR